MARLGIALLLLQGSLFTAIGAEVTPTPAQQQGNNQTDTSVSSRLWQYRLANRAGETCILMEMDAVIDISFKTKSQENRNLEERLEDVQPKGSCDDNKAELTIAWKAFELRWFFSKTQGGEIWYVNEVEITFDKSDALFKNISGVGDTTLSTLKEHGTMLFPTPIGKSYQSQLDYKLVLRPNSDNSSDSATLLLHQFQMQPFMTKQTFGPATELFFYQIRNKEGESCILMELDAYVSINWAVSSHETKEIDMLLQPNKMKTTGSCGNDESQIIMKWKSFRLRWNFAKTRDWKKWFVKNVDLLYDMNALDKQNNNTGAEAMVFAKSSSEVMLFSAPMGEAYDCPSEEELDLISSGTDSATLRLRHFRVQPFVTQTAFGPSYCPIFTTSATLETSTSSSASSDSGSTKNASKLTSDSSDLTSVGTASSASLSPDSAPPSGATTPNKVIVSPAPPAHSTTPHIPIPSAIPSSVLTSDLMSAKQISFNELTATKTPGLTSSTVTPFGPLPPYVYQKTLPNAIKMPFYPPKKVFFSGVKLDNDDALSAMLWSWYTSGFYSGYYQALQQPKKMF